MSEFNVADLVATLRLDKGSYDSDLSASQRRTEQFTSGIEKAGDAMGRSFKGGLTAASVATGIAMTGAVGLLASVTKTGASYNILQQNSRAALKTLLGGSKQANAQMDKLDKFARTSPFAKDVFIKAQQQLLGFGVEGKKVIPIMDAVQQAVAATGGSSADVGGIVEILAKISSTGKMTAEDLNMLGNRGINAAELIGKAMGKTGPQIRDSITNGTLGAEDAIDGLTSGMAKKFKGATALVKQQMTGATDRVKAATRDIGSALAEPFIKKNGGGRAVVWTNEFADALRAAEKKAGPLVGLLTQRLNPAFNDISGLLHDITNTIDGFDVSSVGRGLDQIGEHAPAIAGVAAGFAAMGTQLPVLARLGLSVNPLVAGIAAVVAASPELRAVFKDAIAAGEPLLPLLGKLAGIFSGALASGIDATIPLLEGGVQVFSGLVGAAEPVVDIIGGLAEGFSQLPGPMQTALVAFTGFALLRGKLDWLKDIGQSVGGTAVAGFQKFRNEMDLVHGALRFPEAGQSLQVLDRQISMTSTSGRTSLSKLGTAAKITGKSLVSGLKNAAGGVMNLFGGPWGIALGLGAAALGAYAAKQAEARQRTEEFKATLNETTGAVTENTDAMAAAALAGDDGSKGFYLLSSGAEEAGKTLGTLGKSVQDTAKLVSEGGTDYDNMIGLLKDYEGAAKAAGTQWDAMGNVISKGDGGAALDAWADKMGISSDAARQLSQVDMVHLIARLEEQRGAVSDASSDWSKMHDSTATVQVTQSKIAEAIAAVGDAAGDTSARLEAYQQIIDIMNGKVPNAEENQRKLAATSRTLGEFFRETGEDGKRLNTGLVSAKDGSIALSDAGDRLLGILGPQADAAKAAALAAADQAKANGDAAGAAAAADAALKPMRDTIMGLAEQGYISKDAAIALANSLLGIPGETSVAITDDGSVEATKLKVEDIARLVEKNPKGTITIDDNSPEVIGALTTMGYEVTHLKDGRVRIDSGQVKVTQDRVAALAKKILATPKGKVTITENSPVVIGALEALGFKVTRLPNGKITVTDAGTARQTGGRIDAEARKRRIAKITAQAVNTAVANAALNSVARNRTSTITVTTRNRTISLPGQVVRPGQVGWHNAGGQLPKRAGGGQLPRTGLGQDKILGIGSNGVPTAMVDDEEWVIRKSSAKKYDRLLGMINRDDPALKNILNLQGLASGGRVGWAKTMRDRARNQLLAARRSGNDKRISREEEDYREASERYSRLYENSFDLRRDVRRNEIVSQVESGGGLSVVDRLYDEYKNRDLSAYQRRSLHRTAYGAEKKLVRWAKELESIDTRLDSSTKKYEELVNIQDKASSKMQDESGIQNVVDNVQRNGFTGLSIKSITAGFKTDALRIKAFASKINALRKKGYSGLLLEEIVQMGSEAGSQVADELLKGSSSEVRSLNMYYRSVAGHSNKLGTYLTEAFYKGGVDAANGVIRGLESRQKQIDRAVTIVGKSMERALKRSLGIRSPSKVAAAITENFTGTIRDNLAKSVPGIRVAATGVGGAMAAGVRASNATTAAVNSFATTAGANGERPEFHVHVDALPGTAWRYAQDTARQTVQTFEDEILVGNLSV